ncbi:hypothetical protein TRAPUB_2789 [Trametes pubescens]|uniref:DUF6589 domain-containing protein n=1 Tax=Trametes pubescens TaxID=154538 RepID=A0A1M2VFL6_TRAPU|nr:hypothetical protein TRAPUB_2789 [Trametes pubescens]
MQAISSLNFSRTNRANLFPTALGLVYFALSAPYDVFLLNSRLGLMPAYNKIYDTLEGLAMHESEVVKTHGKDMKTVGVIWLDNVQNYLVQRDARIGREDGLNIGVAATYVELPSCSSSAMDLEDRRRRIQENRRKDLTTEQLVGWVDTQHREIVGTLQWLRVLTTYVPELDMYKMEVSSRYRTDGAKRRLPCAASRVHPLATSGKNESVTTELKDALLDFLEQAGQTPEGFKKQLFMMGGDGLTFEKVVQLKHYLQFHENELESLELVQPVLALWHTAWADLSRIFETHWGSLLTDDPSTLGHSAAKIGRKAPPNLKKVDFNYGADIMYLVLDARMLDCWRLHFKADDLFEYFASRTAEDLPSFEELHSTAKKLYRAYSSHLASERALYSPDPTDERPPGEWEKTVPVGSPWAPEKSSTRAQEAPPSHTQSGSQPSGQLGVSSSSPVWPLEAPPKDTAKQTRKRKRSLSKPREPFRGDQALADSIAFMKDAWVSREFMYAAAEGDVGRVYEAMKMMLFTFAGSSHTKYTSYLLEFLCILELESSNELRDSILGTLLINLTGEAGRFSPADLIQEYFNRLLQAIAERKGIEYDNHFIRDVLSRNLHHLARLLDDLKQGLGLSARSGRHSAPHTNPELKTLLREYRKLGLHTRREGRQYISVAAESYEGRNDYRRGLRNLRSGKLKKWIKETTFMRSVHAATAPQDDGPNQSSIEPAEDHKYNEGSESDLDGDSDPAGDEHSSGPSSTSTTISLARMTDDGDLDLVNLDVLVDAQMLLAELTSEDKEYESADEHEDK